MQQQMVELGTVKVSPGSSPNPLLTATHYLSISTHPDDAQAWPAWATVAMVHQLKDGADLMVTYAATPFAIQTEDGGYTTFCGLQSNVLRLFFWDWGPTEVSPRVRLVLIDDPIDYPAAPGATETNERLPIVP